MADFAELRRLLLAGEGATAAIRSVYGDPVIARRSAGTAATPAILTGFDVIHRRVTIIAGMVIVSEADLWYRPALLTHGMQNDLLSTERPFGDVVSDLQPMRHLAAVRGISAEFSLCLDAVLKLPDDQILGAAHERYF